MSQPSPRIAVVGAGPAGAAAAHTLTRAGGSVVVFEARPAVGGRTRTGEVEGFRVDPAVQLFGSMYTELFRLLREAGAGALAVRSPGRDALLRNGRAHEVVYGSIPSMLASGALPWGLKVRLGTHYLPFLTRHAHALDMHALERAAEHGLDRESIAEWGEREMGREFTEYLAYPFLATGYGVLPEETTAALYHMLAHYGAGVEIFALRGGASGFCEALLAGVRERGGEVRTGSRVDRVEARDSGAEVAGEGWSERFDGAVVAVPAPVAQGLLPGTPAAAWLAGVRMRPAVSLALFLDRPAGVRWFGLSFPRGEARAAAAVAVQENKGPGLVPPGKGLVVVFPTPGAGERLLEAEPRAVLDALLPDVARALPGIDGAVTRAQVFRWRSGWTLFPPGCLARLAEFRRGGVEGDEPVALAGDYLHAPTVEGAVTAGVRAARRVLQRL
ncbi:MAG TPA: NAD(P)/FAD-dependent oxidoreductase [Longimicrobiaceae bacterium]|nr:NAD(P)/FAD-dependent oxidoreductase [Longimicrobiaceae bacterium]